MPKKNKTKQRREVTLSVYNAVCSDKTRMWDVDSVVEASGIERRSVPRCLKRLEERGVMVCQDGMYQLVLDKDGKPKSYLNRVIVTPEMLKLLGEAVELEQAPLPAHYVADLWGWDGTPGKPGKDRYSAAIGWAKAKGRELIVKRETIRLGAGRTNNYYTLPGQKTAMSAMDRWKDDPDAAQRLEELKRNGHRKPQSKSGLNNPELQAAKMILDGTARGDMSEDDAKRLISKLTS